MRLLSFTLENYRSIRQSHRLEFLGRITTLIGPNNEGKSNILRALIAALNGLTRFSQRTGKFTEQNSARILAPSLRRDYFAWERDFPISIQDEHPDRAARFILEFDPSRAERRRLQDLTALPVRGLLGFELQCSVSFLQGCVTVRLAPIEAKGGECGRIAVALQ